MARIKYSALVTSIDGSIGGTTFQRNAYGHTVKKKPATVNPNRIAQQQRKGSFQFVTQQWQAMSSTDRDAWAAYATTYPVPSRLNPSAYLTGQAQWLRTNLLRQVGGGSFITAIVDATQWPIISAFNSITNGGATLTIDDDTAAAGGHYLAMYFASAPVKQSQTYDRSRTRYVGTLDTTLGASVDVAARYLQVFGVLPQTGEFVFLKRVYLNTDNGQVYTYPPSNTEVS